MCHGQQIRYQLWHNHPTIIGDSKHNGFISTLLMDGAVAISQHDQYVNTHHVNVTVPTCCATAPLGVPPLRKPSSCQFVDVVIDGSINTQPGDTDVEQLLLHTFCHFNRALRHQNVFDGRIDFGASYFQSTPN